MSKQDCFIETLHGLNISLVRDVIFDGNKKTLTTSFEFKAQMTLLVGYPNEGESANTYTGYGATVMEAISDLEDSLNKITSVKYTEK